MKKYCILLCALIIYFNAFNQTPSDDAHWNLIFNENFSSLNDTIWKVANEYDHYGEPQVYTNRSTNVYISSGNLVLKINNEDYHCTNLHGWACNSEWYEYTSGWVETKASYNIQYGYIESKIKIPYGYGFWPAFWTFIGDGVSGGNAAEIDIFEMLGDQPPTIMGTNLHMDYCDCNIHNCGCDYIYDQMCPSDDPSILCYGQDVEIESYSDTYHIYAVEWTPSKIIWFVDGKMVRNFPNPGITDPARIILNLAITPWCLPNSTTPFPSRMYIDYVRVYKLNIDNNTINSCNYNFANYDDVAKKSITIGGNGCINSIPTGSNVSLRATEKIELKGDFSVPLGSELYLDVNSN
jgi:beta-glucanase (GH16 family)